MPPRLITGAILVFWLAMTGWLLQREVVPAMLADASPSYQPDLTDEIGAPLIGWRIFRDDKPIGSATSRVVRAMEEIDGKDRDLDDRSYEFRTSFTLDAADILVRKMETARRVSEDGKLMAFSAKFYFRELPGLPKELMTNPFLLKGAVERGRLQPRIFFGDLEIKEFKLGAMDVPSQANDFHPMTLIGRLRGLRVGQTWKVTHFDYGQMLPKEIELLGGFVKKALATPDMIAQVTTATIEWPRKSNRQVECFLIELGERGKEAVYRTWVRRVDGSVLKFELPIMESKMHLVRISN